MKGFLLLAVFLSLIGRSSAQFPCFRISTAVDENRVGTVNGISVEVYEPSNPSVVTPVFSSFPNGQSVRYIYPNVTEITVRVNISAATELSYETVLNTDNYYTIYVLYDTLMAFIDDNSRTGVSARIQLFNSLDIPVNASLDGTELENGAIISGVEAWGGSSTRPPLQPRERVVFDWVNGTGYFTLDTGRAAVLTGTFGAFPGKVYSASFNLLTTSSAFRLIAVAEPGVLVPPPEQPVYVDGCLGVVCPTGYICRNGRCVQLSSSEGCSDYLGFDLTEIARDSLLNIDSMIQTELKSTIEHLKELQAAVEQYDPTTGTVNVTNYVAALGSICHGRDMTKCPDSDCRILLSGASVPGSACSKVECEIPSKCVPLRELEFLEVTFLGALAKVRAANNLQTDDCLEPYTLI